MTQRLQWTASGRLTAAGKSLEYACWGPFPDDAPTLVLLHEGLGSVALWRTFPESLAEATGMGVFAYSRSGYGQSDHADLPRPLNYMTQEATQVLPQVLDAVGVQRCVLIGHSDGATIAAIHAGCLDDQRVHGVVTMAPHFFTETIALTEIAEAKDAFETTALKNRLAKYHQDPDNAFRGWCDSWLHPDFKTWDVTHVVDGIEVPVLAIQGKDDQYGTLAQIEVLTTRCKAPVNTLILDNCRHAPFIDQPEQVIGKISEFCLQLTHPSTQTPSHAYIPGITQRHPEGAFDNIRHSVWLCLSADALSQTAAFTSGIKYLDTGYCWEAHEVLEPVWMALAEGSDERHVVQALIQLANACLKQKMERPKAALRLCGIVRGLLNQTRSQRVMSIDLLELAGRVDELENQLKYAL